jgi:nucleotide-binding universal stress UspA family protein
MERRFSCIVVAADLEQRVGDPVTFAAELAGPAGLRIEIVAELPRTSTAAGAGAELGRRIAASRLDRAPCYLLPTEAPGGATAEHLAGRTGLLVVTAATTWASLGPYLLDAAAEQVLERATVPVLVLGPNCAPGLTVPTTAIAAVDGSEVADAAMPVVEAWVRTFAGSAARVVEVLPSASVPACDAGRHVRRYVHRLAQRGVAASGQVLRGGQPASLLVAYAVEIDGAMLVVPSPRWAGEPSHWFSTTRRIIHLSTRPVLVVPADLPANGGVREGRSRPPLRLDWDGRARRAP